MENTIETAAETATTEIIATETVTPIRRGRNIDRSTLILDLANGASTKPWQ